MGKKNPKQNTNAIMPLREDELSHSGVSKVLLDENGRLRSEIDALKKSLKTVQNELEALRSKNHTLDKENSILNYRLTASALPELLKLFASSVGTGFAVSLFFAGQIISAVISLIISFAIYGGIIFWYRK